MMSMTQCTGLTELLGQAWLGITRSLFSLLIFRLTIRGVVPGNWAL